MFWLDSSKRTCYNIRRGKMNWLSNWIKAMRDLWHEIFGGPKGG
jgi:hypothetical protein